MSFTIYDQFPGYNTKDDPTNTDPRHLVRGSKNVIINEALNIESRKGITYFGAKGTKSVGITASYVWETNTNVSVPVRVDGDGVFEAFIRDEWREIATIESQADFTTWWDESEALDKLIFIDGSTNLYSWTGGNGVVANRTVDTIELEDDVAMSRFLSSGTVVIDGTEYDYTGIDEKTLTGVTPDASGVAIGAFVYQKVTTNADIIGAKFNAELIEQRDNQIYIASYASRNLHVSSTSDFTNYTQPSPRSSGDPAFLTLDKNIKAVVPQDESVYVSAGEGEWYKITPQLSDDLTKETFKIKKLKAGAHSAARSQKAWTEIKDAVAYMTFRPSLDELSRIQEFDNAESKPLSEPIQADFRALNLEDVQTHYFDSKVYITVPRKGLLYIYDIELGLWNPPQTLPIASVNTYKGRLIAHSSISNETYYLFKGYTDIDAPIAFNASFAYQNFNTRAELKQFDEYYTEAYANAPGDITVSLNYEYTGANGTRSFTLNTQQDRHIFRNTEENAFGTEPLGTEPLGAIDRDLDTLSKIRYVHTTSREDFFEFQPVYSSDTEGTRLVLVAHGSNTRLSENDIINIKE